MLQNLMAGGFLSQRWRFPLLPPGCKSCLGKANPRQYPAGNPRSPVAMPPTQYSSLPPSWELSYSTNPSLAAPMGQGGMLMRNH